MSIRSKKLLVPGSWYKIRIGKYGRKLYLFVDNVINTGIMPSADTLRLTGDQLHLGGLPDMSKLPSEATSTLPIPYTGCIRRFSFNNALIALNVSTIKEARNVGDCDGTPCGGEHCFGGGTCWLDSTLRPHCTCVEPRFGDRCEELPSCEGALCRNDGRCVGRRCSCAVGWTGAFCESAISVRRPYFSGNSYIAVNKIGGVGDKKRQVAGDLRDLALNFSTATSSGLLLFRSNVSTV